MTCCHYTSVRTGKVHDPEGAVNLLDRYSATINLRVAAVQPGLVQLNATRSACGCIVSCDVDRTAFLAAVSKVLGVAVIDAEDREQVERLAASYERDSEPGTVAIDQMQAALREFASPKPPKPDEPQGRFACVKDAKGKRWFRMYTIVDRAWAMEGQLGLQERWRTYAEIDAVRVLSEGVPS